MAINKQYQGSFVPTTNVWDVGDIYNLEKTPEELKELLVRLYQNLNIMSVQLNLKDTGYYPAFEFLTNNLYFPTSNTPTHQGPNLQFRSVFRKVIDFGVLPNATSKSVAHGINISVLNSDIIFTRIYATATNPTTSFIPIPYASSTLNENVSLEITATNVVITTAIDYSAYTICYVVLEYIK